jgi:predicted nuclease of predicted toxin-antitoxin system
VTRWLVDAQLPARLAYRLQEAGQDAIHTSDLLRGNATQDGEINGRLVDERRIVITKDADFVGTMGSDNPEPPQ